MVFHSPVSCHGFTVLIQVSCVNRLLDGVPRALYIDLKNTVLQFPPLHNPTPTLVARGLGAASLLSLVQIRHGRWGPHWAAFTVLTGEGHCFGIAGLEWSEGLCLYSTTRGGGKVLPLLTWVQSGNVPQGSIPLFPQHTVPGGTSAMVSYMVCVWTRVVMFKGFRPALQPLYLAPWPENEHYLVLVLSHILLRVNIIPFHVKYTNLASMLFHLPTFPLCYNYITSITIWYSFCC